jgi:hypothetical protein
MQAITMASELLTAGKTQVLLGPINLILIESIFIEGRQKMVKIEGVCRSVLEEAEWVAIATVGDGKIHLVGTWGDYISTPGISENEISVPAGWYNETEKNLERNDQIELLCASRNVQGNHGPGKGCRIRGRGRILTQGKQADVAKAKFSWARGVLLIQVEEVTEML